MKASILLGWSEAKTHREGATDPSSKEPDGGDQRIERTEPLPPQVLAGSGEPPPGA
jgi:hypothetical protein